MIAARDPVAFPQGLLKRSYVHLENFVETKNEVNPRLNKENSAVCVQQFAAKGRYAGKCVPPHLSILSNSQGDEIIFL
jgi:hypothetical protein